MLVKKAKGKNEIRYVIVTDAEIAVAKKMGIPLKTYIKQALMFVAIKRRWKWFFKKESK